MRHPLSGLVRLSAAGTAALLTGGALVPAAPAPERIVDVAAEQGNVPRLGLDAFAQQRAVLDNHADATKRLATDVAAGRRSASDLVRRRREAGPHALRQPDGRSSRTGER